MRTPTAILTRATPAPSPNEPVDTAATVRAVYAPSYWRFDANAAYPLTERVGIKLSALNLTNELYYDQLYASHYAHQAAGRTILGSLSFKY